jgi:hypothetical protein
VGTSILLALVRVGHADAAPQLELGVGIGSGIELGGSSPIRAPGFVAPRLALLSQGPQPGGGVAYLGTIALPLSVEGEAIGVQPGIGILWRPTVDFAYGVGGSAIVGVAPVSFGLVEVSAEGRYYLTVGLALVLQVAVDAVLASEERYIVGGLGGLVVDLDLAGGAS